MQTGLQTQGVVDGNVSVDFMTLCTRKLINTGEAAVDMETKGKTKGELDDCSGPRNQTQRSRCDRTVDGPSFQTPSEGRALFSTIDSIRNIMHRVFRCSGGGFLVGCPQD